MTNQVSRRRYIWRHRTEPGGVKMFRAFPYALRALRRSPGFAGAAVLSPALGIVTATAFFSLADAILSRPFPVRDPDRLVALYGRSVKGEWSSSEGNQL